jgi:hypothetical protein
MRGWSFAVLLSITACGPVHTQGGMLSSQPAAKSAAADAAQVRWQEKVKPLVGKDGETVQKALGAPAKKTQDGTMEVWWYEDQTADYQGTINLFFHDGSVKTFEVHVF